MCARACVLNSGGRGGGGGGGGGGENGGYGVVGKMGEKVSSDIQPLKLDTNVDFASVGGLGKYEKSLKEMIFLPLLYPEIFAKFNVNPPRGVLFYGPPGTSVLKKKKGGGGGEWRLFFPL